MEAFPLGFAVVDIETTGLRARADRIVEIAVVRTDVRGGVIGEMSTLVNPQRDPGPTHIHGITAAHVLGAPVFGEIMGELVRYLSGAVLVGHNLAFDLRFIREEFGRAEHELPAVPRLCTLALGARLWPDLGNHRLSECCRAAGVQHRGSHSALGDARATAALFQHFGRLQASSGAWPWAQELEKVQAIRWPRAARSSRLLSREASAARCP